MFSHPVAVASDVDDVDTDLIGSDNLWRENTLLRDRMFGLRAASLRISASLELETLLRQVVAGLGETRDEDDLVADNYSG